MKALMMLVVILAVLTSLSLSYYLGYKRGYDNGCKNAIIRYYLCENGTCSVSAVIPEGYEIK